MAEFTSSRRLLRPLFESRPTTRGRLWWPSERAVVGAMATPMAASTGPAWMAALAPARGSSQLEIGSSPVAG